jgi:N6-adenosine-specific RNA methylase IME4
MDYTIIYLDPPWKYSNRANHKTRFRGGASGHYPLMTMAEIRALPIPDLAAKNCAVCMWCTYPYLDEQIQLFKHWGFKYRTLLFEWIKLNPKGWVDPRLDPSYYLGKPYVRYSDGLYHSVFFGTGHYTKSNPEPCLLGMRGQVPTITDKLSNTIFAPRREHSRKPDEARERIVELFGDVPRVELFARETAAGWASAGNGVTGRDIRDDIQRLAAPQLRAA